MKTAGRKKSTNIQDLRGGDNANPLTRFQHSMDVIVRSQGFHLKEAFGVPDRRVSFGPGTQPNLAQRAQAQMTRRTKRNGPR